MQLLKIILALTLYANIVSAQKELPVQKAQQWLQSSLTFYFDDSLKLRQLATDRYTRFKTDAMNTDFDGGMNKETFEKKWGAIYDVKQPEVHQGFLIPLQDWNAIVFNCRFVYADKQTLWFILGLTETASDAHFSRYVKLVPINGSYRIDDVIETMAKYEHPEYVAGDFNGDHKSDTLVATFISLIDNRPIAIDAALSYDSLIATVVNKKPLLQLTIPGWKPLLLNPGNYYVLGAELLKNIGSINKTPGDEIAVILSAADWSGINVCTIYSYSKHGWKKIRDIEIREEDISKIKSGKLKPWKN